MTAGRLLLMGSGETSPSMVGSHRAALEAADASRIAILDTPFGFQENADELTARIARYFEKSLRVEVVVARLRSSAAPALERERALAVVRNSGYVFAGPGSPSYALEVWREAGISEALAEVLRRGGTIAFASAAALTAGRCTLPVYEMYKVGADPHWLTGLALTDLFGLPASIVPHWNNAEGGTHDTSRCYIGRRRFELLERALDHGVVGIDEHTSLVLDAGRMEVRGVGTVTLRAGGIDRVLEAGASVPLEEARTSLAAPPVPSSRREPPGFPSSFEDALDRGDADRAVEAALETEARSVADPGIRLRLRAMIFQLGEAARQGLVDPSERVSGFVEALLELREAARQERRYEEADRIRDTLTGLGIEVRDTPGGPDWRLM